MRVATGVLDEPLISRVAETSRKPPNQIQTPIRRAQQQAAGVRCQRAAIELGWDGTALDPSKRARFCATLRLHRAASPKSAHIILAEQLLPDCGGRALPV